MLYYRNTNFHLIEFYFFIPPDERNFIDNLAYLIGELAATLFFAKLCKSIGKFILVQRIDLFKMSFWSTVSNLVLLSAQ